MTAVEWLSEKIRLTNIEALRLKLWDAIEQAKEIEKEQIEKAFDDGVEEGIFRSQSEEYNIEYYVSSDRYYNETFKQQ